MKKFLCSGLFHLSSMIIVLVVLGIMRSWDHAQLLMIYYGILSLGAMILFLLAGVLSRVGWKRLSFLVSAFVIIAAHVGLAIGITVYFRDSFHLYSISHRLLGAVSAELLLIILPLGLAGALYQKLTHGRFTASSA